MHCTENVFFQKAVFDDNSMMIILVFGHNSIVFGLGIFKYTVLAGSKSDK